MPILDMNENNFSKASHNKRNLNNGIILSDDSDVVNVGNKLVNVKIHKPKKISEKSAQLLKRTDKSSRAKSNENSDSKSLLKLSVRMNNCNEDTKCEIFSLENTCQSICNNTTDVCDTNDYNSKLDNASCSRICNSCKNNTKIIKCKSSEGKFHVSIKSERPLYCCKGHKIEFKCDVTCSDNHDGKHDNGPLSLDHESKGYKLDVLFQFLNQMRQMVVSRELSYVELRAVTERLVKDKMNIELLLLTEVIIRAQVAQMSRLISVDLFRQKLTPAVFVISFLKQYQFLKSLSQLYKEILSEYESSYLLSQNLSFDLISRTYFKLIIYDNPRFKEQIESGHLNIKIDKIFDSSMPKDQRDQLKANYAALKSDFHDSSKWRDIDKNIKHILNQPDDIVKSLINYFNRNFTLFFPNSLHFSKNGCANTDQSVTYHSDGSYKELLRTLPKLPEREASSTPNHSSHLHDPVAKVPNSNDLTVAKLKSKHKTHKASLRTNSSPTNQALENIKPPSISGTNSSKTSVGYNSCLSTSSCEENSEEEYIGNNAKTLTGHSSRTSQLSRHIIFKDADVIDSHGDCKIVAHKRCVLRDKCPNGDLDDCEQSHALCKHFVSENGHLVPRTPGNLPVQKFHNDCDDKKALHTLLHFDPRRCYSGIHSNTNSPPMECFKHSNVCCSKHRDNTSKDKDFEIDFEELLKTFGVDTSIRENLEEFEKFLENKLKTDKGKIRPNLEALVRNCRMYCKKLCDASTKDESVNSVELASTEVTKFVYEKSKACCNELFDDSTSAIGKSGVCTKHENGLNNSNASININISSSDTCHSMAAEKHCGTNRVCNCCKNDLFKEQTLSAGPRPNSQVEKMRIKLQKRKLIQQNCGDNQKSTCSPEIQLPDLDYLVNFINGSVKSIDPMTLEKKVAMKSKQIKTRKVTKPSSDNGSVVEKTQNDDSGKLKVNSDGELHRVTKNIVDIARKNPRDSPEIKVSNENRKRITSTEVSDKEVFDPVVEDFKQFCHKIVIPKDRKKLPIDGNLIINGK